MPKTRIFTLAGCFFLSASIILGLYAFSKLNVKENNGFIRNLPSHRLVGVDFIKLNGRAVYFAGGDSMSFYLGNRSTPSWLLRVQSNTLDTVGLRLGGFDTLKLHSSIYTRVNTKNVFLFDGRKPVILSGELSDAKLTSIQKTPFFTDGIPVSNEVYILKVVQKGMHNSLVRLNANNLSDPLYLEKQGDGIFSTDGTLLKIPNAPMLIYTFHYRNQFLCLDTNLKIMYKGRTIDTVSKAKIEVTPVKSENMVTMSKPPLFVSKQSAANDKWLFIHSALKADNEIESAWEHTSVIDVYSTQDGAYQFSFYIDDFDGEKMLDFKVYGDYLYALYANYLYKFKLNF